MRNLRPNVLSRLFALGLSRPTTGPFSVVCADPAWLFADKLPGANRGAGSNYREQYSEDIINHRNFEFEFPDIAEDAILFLWRVASQQRLALDVIDGWGFKQKSEFVWYKRTKNDQPWMGMGRTGRQAHEVCLVATRGRSANVVIDKGVRSVFEAPVPTYEEDHPRIGEAILDKHGNERFHKKTGELLVIKPGMYIHSAKPEFFYTDIVEKMCRGPFCELFGRRSRRGWTVFGNQIWHRPE